MQRVICNKREYFAITEVDEVAPGKVLGFRADHDFTAGPASLVVIPVASPQPWEGPRLAFDTIDEFEKSNSIDRCPILQRDPRNRRRRCRILRRKIPVTRNQKPLPDSAASGRGCRNPQRNQVSYRRFRDP